jgi:hypothetical protein
MGERQGIVVMLDTHARHQLGPRDADEHLAVDKEREPAEHPALGDARAGAERLSHALGKAFIE